MKRALCLLILLVISLTSSAQLYQEYLLSDWTFKSTSARHWLPAEVPGILLDDLLNNGKESVKTSDTTWQYQTSFIVDKQILSRDFIELLFKGLDTHATVYLNQERILDADNMFRSWSVPIKPFVKEGENELLIEFIQQHYSPSVRKAFYHYDSGSPIIPVGVWKPVILESWNGFRLDDVSYKVDEIADKEAHLTASIDFRVEGASSVDIELFDEVSGKTFARERLVINKAKQQIEIPFVINRPKLWWPAALGKPNLYKIGVRVKSDGNEQTMGKRIGIREVKIDPSSTADNFRLMVNGKSVLVKTALYGPFAINASKQSTYEYDSNFMIFKSLEKTVLHVKSFGIYESPYFYDLADVNGMLILQDFMFPSADYPKSDSFLKNVKAEAVENIKALQHHPSIVAWGGIVPEYPNTQEGSVHINQILEDALKEVNSSYFLLTK